MREDERAVLEVPDTGIAISQPDLQRLFQRFVRTQRATSAAVDASMAPLDGLETARRLRERAATGAVPIMPLTARVAEADRQRGRQAGVDAQLDKPFSPAVLAERVRALLDERPTRGSAQ
jgi:two-component system, OmpR family, response regulator ChvI